MTGQLSIGGADGTVRVTIANVNDAHGNPLGQGTLAVQLHVRVNGLRRRVTIPLPIDTGGGNATNNLGLRAGDQVIVIDARVRGIDHRTLAEAGVVTADVASGPSPPSAPPASLSQCQAALDTCNSDLAQCTQDLDICQSGG